MKKISIVVPCYNEAENILAMSKALTAVMAPYNDKYEYEIIFIENCSTDNTRSIIRQICKGDERIKAIFNIRNFGPFNSPYYGLLQSTGDCAILFSADFQDPLNMISKFIEEWENGYKIVIGQKTSSKENHLMYMLRSCYYKLIKAFSDIQQIEHFTGFGLYDKQFLEVLRSLKDPMPFLRGLVAELGAGLKIIPYEQQKRRAGKSSYNFMRYYDAAMLGFTSYTKIGLRVATFIGVGVAVLSLLIAIVYFILKLIYWDKFVAGISPILIGIFFLGAIQLMFLGIMGEYILNINIREMNRPLVVEEERINFKSS